MSADLAYIGKVTEIEKIEGADRIVLATAVCGKGGKWRGIVPIATEIGAKVVVFQPDSLLPSEPAFAFMEKYHYRVKQRRFKGCPSESLILLASELGADQYEVGSDVTLQLGVQKYEKPVGKHFTAETVGLFPSFIPKTDEPNFQKVPEMVQVMQDMPCYITLKMDGMSSTAFRWNGEFGVCSRNLQIKDGDNAIWKVVHKYKLDEKLPEGMAIQWETCGPGIQGNPIGLKEVEGYLFNVYNIETRTYVNRFDPAGLWDSLMPTPQGLMRPNDIVDIQKYAEEFTYPNGKPAEGIVVRPLVGRWELVDREMQRLSYKVINLLYKD